MPKLIFLAMVLSFFGDVFGEELKIVLRSGNASAVATLNGCAAARSFYNRLPLRLNLTDYGGFEKSAKLPKKLDISDSPKGSDAKPGDIAYFAPWNNFTLYYERQDYYPGVVVLGRFDVEYLGVVKDGQIIIDKSE